MSSVSKFYSLGATSIDAVGEAVPVWRASERPSSRNRRITPGTHDIALPQHREAVWRGPMKMQAMLGVL